MKLTELLPKAGPCAELRTYTCESCGEIETQTGDHDAPAPIAPAREPLGKILSR
jgi:hypothetical protein